MNDEPAIAPIVAADSATGAEPSTPIVDATPAPKQSAKTRARAEGARFVASKLPDAATAPGPASAASATPASNDGKTSAEPLSKPEAAPAPTGEASWAPEAQAAIKQHRDELAHVADLNAQWRDAGFQTLATNQRLVARLKLAEDRLTEAGIQLDPRDIRLIDYEAQHAQSETSQRAQQAQAQRAQDARHESLVAEYTTAINADLQKAVKATGATRDVVARAYAALHGVDPATTIEDVIDIVTQKMRAAQAKANAGAPSGLRPAGTGSLVTYEPGRAGRIQRLKDRGHMASHDES